MGEKDDWVQDYVANIGGSTPFSDTITPDSGFVHISYVKDDGSTAYWDDDTQAYVVGPVIDNPTVISGTLSKLPYTHLEETLGKTVVFEGWIVRNGVATPHDYSIVEVRPDTDAALLDIIASLTHADVEFPSPIDPES